jgi:hypothetical protein
MMRTFQRQIALFLSLLLVFSTTLPARAAMIGNQQIIQQPAGSVSRHELLRILEEDAAREQLQALGVSPDWARTRVNSLTDIELARINQGIADLNTGESSILGVLLVVFIVFVITDVIGATDIFPFIHPVK